MTTSPIAQPAGGIYPGWRVLAATFACSMLVIGSTIYLFGLLVVPASEELGLTRAEANEGYIAFLVGMTIWGPIAGWLVDRMNAKVIVPAGALMMLAGYATVAATDRLWLMALMLFGPIAIGGGFAGLITGSALNSRWFRRRRGRALGIFAMASSVGGFSMSPLSAMLIEEYGWRTALMIIGIALATIISVLGLFVIRDRPTDEELKIEEYTQASATQSTSEGRKWTLRDLLHERNFFLILIGMGLIYASDQILVISKVPYMQDQGVTLTAASFVVSCQSASAICGKLVVGYLAERVDIVKIFAVVVVFHLTLLALYITWPGYWVVLFASCVIGIAIGGVYPVKLLLVAKAFGSTSYAFVMGVMSLGTQPLSVIGLYATGVSYDRTGTYIYTFGAMMGAVVISYILVRLVRFSPAQSAPAVMQEQPA